MDNRLDTPLNQIEAGRLITMLGLKAEELKISVKPLKFREANKFSPRDISGLLDRRGLTISASDVAKFAGR